MKPILYPANETEFVSNGLGTLSDAISAHAITAINSTYEIDLIYPMDGVHFSEIHEGSMILAPHDDMGTLEPYEVYAISAPMNGKVIINAWHNSYKLNGLIATPFEAGNINLALVALKNACMTECPFNFSSPRSTSANIKTTVPLTMRQALGGVQGSFLDVYGGEWEFSGWDCILKNRLGDDTDVVIKYAKNLMDAKKKTTINKLWTGIVPYWTSDAGNVYYNGVIESDYASSAPREMTIPVDCTSDFETAPTQAQLEEWGEAYVARNAQESIPTSIDVSFVALWQTDEYKNYVALELLKLGDSITVYHPDLGINHSARIVSTDYDILNERYSKMTIGSVKANIATSIQNTISEVTRSVPTKDWFEQRLAESTALITGGLGGYIVINRNASGQPEEIVIMDEPNITDAVNCIRLNKNGIGFSTNGYGGPFNSAWTIGGTLDMGVINVANLSASDVVTGTIRDRTGTNYWNLDTGEFNLTWSAQVGARNYVHHSDKLDFGTEHFLWEFTFNGDQALLNGNRMEVVQV